MMIAENIEIICSGTSSTCFLSFRFKDVTQSKIERSVYSLHELNRQL